MESTLLESFKIAPALVALVVVVYLFIQTLKWMIKHNEAVAKERTVLFGATVKTMHDEHMEARRRSHDLVDKLAVSNMELAKVMGEVRTALADYAESRRQAGMR